MAVQLRFAQGATIGEYGQALVVAAGSAVTISARATGATTIASWRIRCWFSSDAVQFNPTVGSTGDVSPAAVASGTNASPTATFTPPTSGPYIFSVETWSDAAGTLGAAVDVRELHVRWVNIADCEPAPVIGTTLKGLIDAQIAAGAGPHNNFSGVAFGWATRMHAMWSALDALITAHATTSSNATTALANAGTAQSRADSAYSLAGTANSTANAAAEAIADTQELVDSIAVPETLPFSTTISCTQTGIMVYSGADQSLVFTADVPPYTPSAMVTVVIPAGTVTGAHTVTVDAGISQVTAWPSIDPLSDFVLRFFAETSGSIAAVASIDTRPDIDILAPIITAATVEDQYPNRIAVTTNEATLWGGSTGFSLPGFTLGAVTGSGTTHYIAMTPAVQAGANIGTLTWDGTNTVTDGSLNALSAGSRSVVNNRVAPTITTASIVGSTLTLNMSEACICYGVIGLSLAGTSATISSLSGGSGSTTLTFALSETVSGGTVTLSATESNQITDSGGAPLAAVSNMSVQLAAAPVISSAHIDEDELTIVYDQAVTHSSTANWIATIDGVQRTVAYASGSTTNTLVYTTSAAAANGDVVTISATAPTGHASSSTYIALNAFTGTSVTNNTGGSSWEDTFDRADGAPGNGWTGTTGATAEIVSNALNRTDTLGYRWFYNLAGGVLPADMRVTITIPHAMVSLAFWGIGVRYNTADNTGTRLIYYGGAFYIGSTTAYNAGDAQSAWLTGYGNPAWVGTGDHTLVVEFDGVNIRIWTDADPDTDPATTTGTVGTSGTNTTTAGLGICFLGEGGTGILFNDITVEPLA